MYRFTGCLLAVVLAAGLHAANSFKTGYITTDEVWSDTVTITGDVLVDSAQITIMPGTRVQFDTLNDNVVTGESGTINLGFRHGSAVAAFGTAQEPILFTTAAAVPSPGRWGEVDIAGNLEVDSSGFSHCIFEYGNNALDFRYGMTSDEWSTNELLNPIDIDHCTIRHMDRSGIYITSGGEPNITNCTFHDIVSTAVFAHGARTVEVETCIIYDVSVGIISAGEAWWERPQLLHSIHNTIWNVDYDKQDNPKWWTGYGIYCTNTIGTLYLHNTIISSTTLEGVALNGWYFNKRNNCYFETGSMPIADGGDIHSKSIEDDPLFTDPQNGDFSLQTGSPCIGAASDGTNIGASQAVAVHDRGTAGAMTDLLTVTNPTAGRVVIRYSGTDPVTVAIRNLRGETVMTEDLAPGGQLAWASGIAGVYVLEATNTTVKHVQQFLSRP